MTGALDSVFRPLAPALINKFGTAATLRRRTSAFTASTGVATQTDADTAVVITPPAPFKESRIEKGLAIVGDMQCMVAAQGLAIAPSAETDHVVHAGIEWHVVDVQPVYSGNLVAAYKLHLRR